MDTRKHIQEYLDDLRGLLDQVEPAAVDELVDLLVNVWRDGRRVLLMGNGGSSSTVSHIVNDMQKNVQLSSGRALKAMCLSDCTPLLMAWANDTEWSNVFAPQVECWAEPGDLVIGVSGSGGSMNVVNGIVAARRTGATTFGLAGYDGGRLASEADRCIVVHSRNMQRIEDVHMVILHMAFSAACARAAEEAAVDASGSPAA